MAIKVGDIVVIRTSEEPAFVLKVHAVNPVACGGTEDYDLVLNSARQMSGFVVDVRVPVLQDGGIVHKIQTFLLEELESIEDNHNRKQGQLMRMIGRGEPDATAAPANDASSEKLAN